jgi:hypothetical protein
MSYNHFHPAPLDDQVHPPQPPAMTNPYPSPDSGQDTLPPPPAAVTNPYSPIQDTPVPPPAAMTNQAPAFPRFGGPSIDGRDLMRRKILSLLR